MYDIILVSGVQHTDLTVTYITTCPLWLSVVTICLDHLSFIMSFII